MTLDDKRIFKQRLTKAVSRLFEISVIFTVTRNENLTHGGMLTLFGFVSFVFGDERAKNCFDWIGLEVA